MDRVDVGEVAASAELRTRRVVAADPLLVVILVRGVGRDDRLAPLQPVGGARDEDLVEAAAEADARDQPDVVRGVERDDRIGGRRVLAERDRAGAPAAFRRRPTSPTRAQPSRLRRCATTGRSSTSLLPQAKESGSTCVFACGVGRVALGGEDRRREIEAARARGRRVRLRLRGRRRSARRRGSVARPADTTCARGAKARRRSAARAGSAGSFSIGGAFFCRSTSAPAAAITSPAVPATVNASSVPPVAESQPTISPPSGASPFHA